MTTRRDFLKTAATSAAVAGGLSIARNAWAGGSDEIRVGLVGCGGRGSDAAMNNVLAAAPNVKIVSLGDVFKEPIDRLCRSLTGKFKDKVDITDDRCHVGLDAIERVLADDINYIILTTPPGFRPDHLQKAVKSGKVSIFTEKPVCVDGPGFRKVMEAYKEAESKKVNIVAGTQRRHQTGYLETIKRIHDGAIGEIVSARAYWNGGDIWFKDRLPGMSDVAYHCYNWYHFLWTCGDHICEQHVHNLDVVNWAMNAVPVSATGMGGRSRRKPTDPRERPDPKDAGQIFDHFAVEYVYPNGTVLNSFCRQITGCIGNISEALVGTKGKCQVNEYRINNDQVLKGHDNRPYIQEHTDLIEHIRGGKYINELKTVAESTLTAILGRMATYTGQEVTWEQAVNSHDDTFPKDLKWEMDIPVSPAPIPGQRVPRAGRAAKK